jgi:hypothetical protein
MDTAFWFTANKEAALSREVGASGSKHLMPVYLRACKLAGWDEYDRLTYDQLISEGFDGVKLDDNFIVFDAKAIKSADKNSGLYDPTSPSLSDAEQAHDLGLAALSSQIVSDETKPSARSVVPLWVNWMMEACAANEAGFHFEEGGCFAMAKAMHEELVKIEPLATIAINPTFVHAVAMLGPLGIDHQGDLTLEYSKLYTKNVAPDDIEKEAFAAGHSEDDFSADLNWARNVIRTAKEMCLDHQEGIGQPLHLADANAIAQHVLATSSDPDAVDFEFVEEMMWGKQAILVNVPIEQIKADELHADNHVPIRGRDAFYAKMPSTTRPPILLKEDGCIQDGHHRHRSGIMKGDRSMLAYQLLDDAIDLGLSPAALTFKP